MRQREEGGDETEIEQDVMGEHRKVVSKQFSCNRILLLTSQSEHSTPAKVISLDKWSSLCKMESC